MGAVDNKNFTGGQAMLMMVVILSSLILIITGVATLLVRFQVRQGIDAAVAAQALFAADAGIEDALFCYFQNVRLGIETVLRCEKIGQPVAALSSGGAKYNVRYARFSKPGLNSGDSPVYTQDPRDPDITSFEITAVGEAGASRRILEASFDLR